MSLSPADEDAVEAVARSLSIAFRCARDGTRGGMLAAGRYLAYANRDAGSIRDRNVNRRANELRECALGHIISIAWRLDHPAPERKTR